MNLLFRTYWRESGSVHGQNVSVIGINSLGNAKLKPERGTEWEGGFDLGLWDERVTFDGTIYRKLTRDALMPVDLPPSFGGGSRYDNIGTVSNRGLEGTIGLNPLRNNIVDWSMWITMSKNDNKVVSVNQPVRKTAGFNTAVPGYPVGGTWDRAVIAYFDANENGIIEPWEIQYSDSLVYLGQPQPKAEMTMRQSVSLFSRKVTLSAGLNYKAGLTQENFGMRLRCMQLTCRGLFDPTASLAEQAVALSGRETPYAFREEVSWLRLYELSVTFHAPQQVQRLLRAQSASLSIMGRNLAMWSHYRGVDPELSSLPFGEGTRDHGGMPQPREWSIRLNLGL
jgi:hypothetical protein